MKNFILSSLLVLAATAFSEPIPRPVSTAAALLHREAPDDCTFFEAPATKEEDCEYFATRWAITVEDFIAWNPSVGTDCSRIAIGQEYCVERNWGLPVPSSTTSTSATSSTSTKGGSPSATNTFPSPVQEGIIKTCTTFYKAVKGDICDNIVRKYGTFTVADFIAWNPAVGSDCKGLWAETYYCVGIPGTPTGIRTSTTASTRRTTTTSSTTRGNGIATPTPTQPSMVKNCDRFYFVKSGDTCQQIAARFGITTQQLNSWNPSIGTSCSGLWANAYVCVRVIGFVYPVSATCYTTGKTWGDNKPAALSSITDWCDGNSSKDGSGGFATGQQKYGCYNAPFGNNKIEFWIRNDFGIGQSLSVAKCNQLVKLPVDRCGRGGTGGLESWYVRAAVYEGRC